MIDMNFATLHFDTYKVVNLLMGKGYSKDEAEGFIEAIQEVTLSGVATKQDIDDIKESMNDLRQDMNDLRIATKQDIDDVKESMNDLRIATKQDIDEVRGEIQSVRDEIQGVRKEIQDVKNELIKFQLIQTLAILGLMFTMFQFFI